MTIQTKVLLNAVTATGAGATYFVHKKLAFVPDLSVQITDTGAATQITVTIEGSLDDVTWTTMQTQDVTASGELFFVIDKPAPFIRGNLTVLTAGTAPTVTMMISHEE